MQSEKIAFLGCGKLGKCIMNALIESKTFQQSNIYATRRCQKALDDIKNEFFNINCTQNNIDAINNCQIILISVEPKQVEPLLQDIHLKCDIKNKLFISVAAGVSLDQLQNLLPEAIVIRAMTGVTALVRQGMVVLSSKNDVEQKYRDLAQQLMSHIGRVTFLDESKMNSATAICGSGPAFYFLILEAMAEGGLLEGVDMNTSIEMAAQTMLGAATMILEKKMHPAVLKQFVTTPGGCTIAGLTKLEDGNIRSTIIRSVQEATKVAGGLAKK